MAANYEDDTWQNERVGVANPLANSVDPVITKRIRKKRDRTGLSRHIHPPALISKQCLIESTRIVPDNVRNDYFSNPTYCDIEISGNKIDTISQALLQITIQNDDGVNPCQLDSAWNWFRYISIMVNGEDENVYYYPADLRRHWCDVPSEKFQSNATMIQIQGPYTGNLSTSFDSTFTLAINGNLGYVNQAWLPLDIGIFNKHTYWKKVMCHPRYRLYFNNRPSLFVAGSSHTNNSDLSITNLQMYFTGCIYHGKSAKLINEMYSKPYTWQSWEPNRMILSVPNVTSLTETGYLYLNSLQGRYMRIEICALKSADVGVAGLADAYVSIEQYTLRTAGGDVISFEDVPAAIQHAFSSCGDKSLYKSILQAKSPLAGWGAGNFGLPQQQFGPYFDTYTDDYDAARDTGAVYGAIQFDAKDTIQLIFGTDIQGNPLSGDDITLFIYGLQRCQYTFFPKNGKFKFVRL